MAIRQTPADLINEATVRAALEAFTSTPESPVTARKIEGRHDTELFKGERLFARSEIKTRHQGRSSTTKPTLYMSVAKYDYLMRTQNRTPGIPSLFTWMLADGIFTVRIRLIDASHPEMLGRTDRFPPEPHDIEPMLLVPVRQLTVVKRWTLDQSPIVEWDAVDNVIRPVNT